MYSNRAIGTDNKREKKWTGSFAIKFLSSIFLSVNYSAQGFAGYTRVGYASYLHFIDSFSWMISSLLLYFQYRRNFKQSWLGLRGFWIISAVFKLTCFITILFFKRNNLNNKVFIATLLMNSILLFFNLIIAISTLIKPFDFKIKNEKGLYFEIADAEGVLAKINKDCLTINNIEINEIKNRIISLNNNEESNNNNNNKNNKEKLCKLLFNIKLILNLKNNDINLIKKLDESEYYKKNESFNSNKQSFYKTDAFENKKEVNVISLNESFNNDNSNNYVHRNTYTNKKANYSGGFNDSNSNINIKTKLFFENSSIKLNKNEVTSKEYDNVKYNEYNDKYNYELKNSCSWENNNYVQPNNTTNKKSQITDYNNNNININVNDQLLIDKNLISPKECLNRMYTLKNPKTKFECNIKKTLEDILIFNKKIVIMFKNNKKASSILPTMLNNFNDLIENKINNNYKLSTNTYYIAILYNSNIINNYQNSSLNKNKSIASSLKVSSIKNNENNGYKQSSFNYDKHNKSSFKNLSDYESNKFKSNSTLESLLNKNKLSLNSDELTYIKSIYLQMCKNEQIFLKEFYKFLDFKNLDIIENKQFFNNISDSKKVSSSMDTIYSNPEGLEHDISKQLLMLNNLIYFNRSIIFKFKDYSRYQYILEYVIKNENNAINFKFSVKDLSSFLTEYFIGTTLTEQILLVLNNYINVNKNSNETIKEQLIKLENLINKFINNGFYLTSETISFFNIHSLFCITSVNLTTGNIIEDLIYEFNVLSSYNNLNKLINSEIKDILIDRSIMEYDIICELIKTESFLIQDHAYVLDDYNYDNAINNNLLDSNNKLIKTSSKNLTLKNTNNQQSNSGYFVIFHLKYSALNKRNYNITNWEVKFSLHDLKDCLINIKSSLNTLLDNHNATLSKNKLNMNNKSTSSFNNFFRKSFTFNGLSNKLITKHSKSKSLIKGFIKPLLNIINNIEREFNKNISNINNQKYNFNSNKNHKASLKNSNLSSFIESNKKNNMVLRSDIKNKSMIENKFNFNLEKVKNENEFKESNQLERNILSNRSCNNNNNTLIIDDNVKYKSNKFNQYQIQDNNINKYYKDELIIDNKKENDEEKNYSELKKSINHLIVHLNKIHSHPCYYLILFDYNFREIMNMYIVESITNNSSSRICEINNSKKIEDNYVETRNNIININNSDNIKNNEDNSHISSNSNSINKYNLSNRKRYSSFTESSNVLIKSEDSRNSLVQSLLK